MTRPGYGPRPDPRRAPAAAQRRPVERPRSGSAGRPPRKRKLPLWTRLCTALGAVVLVLAGSGLLVPSLLSAKIDNSLTHLDIDPDLVGADISGAFNFLLIGIDSRNNELSAANGDADDSHILSDSMIIAHVPASHDQVYLVSLPRDTYVDNLDGLNAAFAEGAGSDASKDGMTRGATSLINEIHNTLLDGDLKSLAFAGVAVINFEGFAKVIDQLDGVTMCVDEYGNSGDPGVHSIHYYQDGSPAYLNIFAGDNIKAGKFYPYGCQEMKGWEALDYSRQRDDLPDGDFGRQRHQQQLIKAIMKKIGSVRTATNLAKVNGLIDAAGDLLAVSLGSYSLQDWAATMLGVGPNNLTMIKTNGDISTGFNTVTPDDVPDTTGYCNDNRCYQELDANTRTMLRALRDDSLYSFLAAHPEFIASDGDTGTAQ